MTHAKPGAFPTSGNRESMSLTRNVSKLRTVNLLGSEENPKHTNSQTIMVEKSGTNAAFAKQLEMESAQLECNQQQPSSK